MKYQSVVFSGLPGAGKSTLVKKLSQIYNWPIYSVGEIWRQRWLTLYPRQEIAFEEYWSKTSHQERVQINVEARKNLPKIIILLPIAAILFICAICPCFWYF